MSEEKGFEVNDRRKAGAEGAEPEAGAAGAAKEEEKVRTIEEPGDMPPANGWAAKDTPGSTPDTPAARGEENR